MSSWRYTVKALHRIGGQGVRTDFDDGSGMVSSYGLEKARALGLLTSDGGPGSVLQRSEGHVISKRSLCTYTLTQLGRDYCEGRVAEVITSTHKNGNERNPGRGPIRFALTWLASLPRDIRITPPEPQPC